MNTIAEYIDMMDDELEMAEKYALKAEECALHKHREHASTYIEIAEQEIGHYEKLGKMLTEKIEMYQTEKAMYDGLKMLIEAIRKRQMEQMAEAKYILSEARKAY